MKNFITALLALTSASAFAEKYDCHGVKNAKDMYVILSIAGKNVKFIQEGMGERSITSGVIENTAVNGWIRVNLTKKDGVGGLSISTNLIQSGTGYIKAHSSVSTDESTYLFNCIKQSNL